MKIRLPMGVVQIFSCCAARLRLDRRVFPTLFVLAAAMTGFGQSGEEDNTDLQSWNDLKITIPVNKKFDVVTETTLRLEDNISRAESYRFRIGGAFKPTENFAITPWMNFISSRSSDDRLRYEYRVGVDGRVTLLKKAVEISHRSRLEHRSRPGRNSWRYRPSITIEKELPESFIKDATLFVTEEPFYDSRSGKFSRNRISAGIEKTVNKKFAFELYYLYQGDNFSSPGSVHVLGTSWNISL